MEEKIGSEAIKIFFEVLLLQPLTFTCSKSTIETLEKDVKLFNVNNKETRMTLF